VQKAVLLGFQSFSKFLIPPSFDNYYDNNDEHLIKDFYGNASIHCAHSHNDKFVVPQTNRDFVTGAFGLCGFAPISDAIRTHS
jgi:hypothetical protein